MTMDHVTAVLTVKPSDFAGTVPAGTIVKIWLKNSTTIAKTSSSFINAELVDERVILSSNDEMMFHLIPSSAYIPYRNYLFQMGHMDPIEFSMPVADVELQGILDPLFAPDIEGYTDNRIGRIAFEHPPIEPPLNDEQQKAVRDAIGADSMGITGAEVDAKIAKETTDRTAADMALGDRIGDIRQLPELPASGSRDNKIPKFSCLLYTSPSPRDS